jgi:predicted secreted protein
MAAVSLTKANNGQSIEVRQGDEIILRLPENPTTRYRWHIDRADRLSQEMSELVQSRGMGLRLHVRRTLGP